MRTKRTLRRAQLVLDRLHEEISGVRAQRKAVRDYCAEWLATKEPETAFAYPSFLPCLDRESSSNFWASADVPINELTKTDIVTRIAPGEASP